ncbi:MAG TPA: DUF1489 family protein, partial [Alphaproteobacteria bacterium]
MTTIHLLRTAAGLKDLQELREVQNHFRTRSVKGLGQVVVVTTRNTPRRSDDLLNGGSLFWIVKNAIQARQEIKDIRTIKDADGESSCQILLDPQIIRVLPVAQKAVQGWRYLEIAKAPRDLGVLGGANDDLPPEDMAD